MPDVPTQNQPDRWYKYDTEAKVITIVTSGVITRYTHVPLGGMDHRLVKDNGVEYHVVIDDQPQYDLCNCPAGRWGYQCRHKDILRHLLTDLEPNQET